MKKLSFFFLIAVLLFACNPVEQKKEVKTTPKNIILLIGDGMGVSQVYTAMTAQKGELQMARCPVVGLIRTNSADNYITDSGAAGTALACGTKTKNGAVGVDTSGKAIKSILEYAEEKGLAIGLVSTAAITHATPAAFIAHNISRGEYEAIAEDFLKTDIDVFIGGGFNHFANRSDSINLVDQLAQNGYAIATTMEEVNQSNSDKLAGLVFEEQPPSLLNGRGDMLIPSSLKALEIIEKDEDGFFIMIESAQIDWGGHAQNTEYIVSETVEFDQLVGKMLDYAETDGETLVIVTADHETGGFALTGGSIEEGIVEGGFPTNYHTSVLVPVFAYGPGAEAFGGVYENTDIFVKMYQAFGF